jgi:bifunctional UDP-N-acetylglucosamine pyrophosphorylase / glucosamine-1-phosphate N-acetyltransferase
MIKDKKFSTRQNKASAIILAAGKGTRMQSDIPKALYEIQQRPMVKHVIDAAHSAGINDIVVVGGYKMAMLKNVLAQDRLVLIKQRQLLGSAHAVKQASGYFKNNKKTIVVLYADTPLIRPSTIKQMLRKHNQRKSDLTLLSAVVSDAKEYGRIIRDKKGQICKIAEHADLTPGAYTASAEINAGTYCVNSRKLFEGLDRLKINLKKREYYLTDIVEYFYKKNYRISSHVAKDADEALGVNTRHDAIQAEGLLRRRVIVGLLDRGVEIKDVSKVYIAENVEIGAKTIIYPFVVIEKGVIIGPDCRIGPFAHLRQGTVLKKGSCVGNYVEINRSILGERSRVKHHSYLGDAIIGKNTNIGAGTITANYDGKKKNKTIIKDNAFLGSGTTVVAPVYIGKGSVTGAGSVVLKNTKIPDNAIFAGVPARPLKRRK